MSRKIHVYTFYRFIHLRRIKSLKKKLDEYSNNKNIYGSLLIAREGINGTISGSKNNLNEFISFTKKLLKIKKLLIKSSESPFVPFYRLKIRLKKEIVTIGDRSIKPEKLSGKKIFPKDWDKVINNKKYMIIDTRNEYEINIGKFKNVLNPNTKSFKDFPNYINRQKIKKDQPIAMYCTGGIRCEKASSYLLKNGYMNVSQLDGGILNYLEYKKNKKNSLWTGECFVFDNRVSINKKLDKGKYDQCYGCRHPITNEDKKLKSFKKGVHCKYCIRSRTTNKIRASITRQKQIDIAEKKRKNHSFKKIYTL